jgi:hypothetical protein
MKEFYEMHTYLHSGKRNTQPSTLLLPVDFTSKYYLYELYEMWWIQVLWRIIFKVCLLIESLLYCTLYYYLCLLIDVNDFD